jgi:hypothetical protein
VALMDDANATMQAVKSRFKWVSDGEVDSYHIMASEGPIDGDCDDFAITVLWELAGCSRWRFLWWLVSFKGVLWFVRDPKGARHITLWVRGVGYTDNWKSGFTPTEELHERRYPLAWPFVLFKLLVGKFDAT